MRRALLVLAVVSCTPGPARPKEPAPHPYFPIDVGAKHELGKVTADNEKIECTSCHARTVTNFHSFSCLGCHRHSEDLAAVDHGVTGTKPLVEGYVYASNACYGCHGGGTAPRVRSDPARDVHVEALVPTFSGNAIIDFIDAGQDLAMVMNHALAGSNCESCHANADLGTFYPGQFHLTDAGVPLKCNGCHANAAPIGFVGALNARRIPASGPMRHETVTGDCSWCHVPPKSETAVSWKSASFHPALTDGGHPQPTTCLECHANSRPGLVNYDAGYAVPPGLQFNHQAVWTEECSECHHQTNAWAPGFFHDTRPRPASCLPCHAGERLSVDDGGARSPPFDLITNARGVTHGGGQDCALCHNPGNAFRPATYSHDAGLALTTCVACHSTQRPQTVVQSFDHSTSGRGDCFGCHQATTQHSSLADWAGGVTFPGPFLIASDDKFITVTQYGLRRTGDAGFITGVNSLSQILYNAMLHTSPYALDAGDPNGCWHCHTVDPGTTNVTSFLGGSFHAALTNFRSAPDAGIAAISQPADRCLDCHSNMRPPGIVQNTSLKPMDHRFSSADCSLCHATPGASWNDGVFHSKVDAGSLDCSSCHWMLLEDSSQTVDVISSASPGPKYKMQHHSQFMPTQRCETCHPAATTTPAASTSWRPGVVHSSATSRPNACADCHRQVSIPTDVRKSDNNGQFMNHQAALVTAKDCAFCHAEQAGMTWQKTTRLHIAGIAPTGCSICHAQNVPAALDDTATVTSSSASPGVHDQIAHSDVNVTGHDCNFCHKQVGPAGGGTWATAASFHLNFTGGNALQLNGTTGRCSNCHLNVKPGAAFAAQDHSAFTATSATDCSSCHQWPGSLGATSPSWHRPGSAPQTISVGGFTIAQPPAASAGVAQVGVNGLQHPAVPTGGSCTTCHAMASGGKGATGYDHALAPVTGCSSCHEAGSNLVGTPWTLSAPNAAASCAMGSGMVADHGGDTRPVGITSLACSINSASKTCGSASCASNHFFPVDCGECHGKPSGSPVRVQTGASYVAAWRFVHNFGAPTQQSTCSKCH